MKKILILATLIVAPLYTTALDIGGNVTIGSDYLWRGASQKGSPAISAGVELEHEGFYTGAWISQVDYGDNSDYEYDFYTGYGFNLTDDLSVDAGIIQYNFNNEPGNQLEEWYLGGTFKGFTATYYQDLDNSDNHFAEYSYDIPVEHVNLSVFYQDPNDFYGINISRDISVITLAATVGQDRDGNGEAVLNAVYNF